MVEVSEIEKKDAGGKASLPGEGASWLRSERDGLFFFKILFYFFRQRRREGEREGEKHQCVVCPPLFSPIFPLPPSPLVTVHLFFISMTLVIYCSFVCFVD